jgi:hypothetical protein
LDGNGVNERWWDIGARLGMKVRKNGGTLLRKWHAGNKYIDRDVKRDGGRVTIA